MYLACENANTKCQYGAWVGKDLVVGLDAFK